MSRVDLSMFKDKPYQKGLALVVSEIIIDTVQGEGAFIGIPAVFLRLTGCHLKCSFCDTEHIWTHGVRIDITQLEQLFQDTGIFHRFLRGHHLIITGGAPLIQSEPLSVFLQNIRHASPCRVVTQIENEGTIPPMPTLRHAIDVWNTSPKLRNSGVVYEKRVVPEAIIPLHGFNDFFKFVISKKEDWDEIEETFLQTHYIKKEQIILMPMGKTREEIRAVEKMVIEMTVEHGVRYSPRLHIDVWDGADGV